MAEATLKPVEPVKPSILLELTPEEAETLRIVCGRVGGDPRTTLRKHTDAIGIALNSVGVDYDYGQATTNSTGTITFVK